MRLQKTADPVEAEILADSTVDGERHIQSLSLIINFVKDGRTV